MGSRDEGLLDAIQMRPSFHRRVPTVVGVRRGTYGLPRAFVRSERMPSVPWTVGRCLPSGMRQLNTQSCGAMLLQETDNARKRRLVIVIPDPQTLRRNPASRFNRSRLRDDESTRRLQTVQGASSANPARSHRALYSHIGETTTRFARSSPAFE